jgi:hypothetical protein
MDWLSHSMRWTSSALYFQYYSYVLSTYHRHDQMSNESSAKTEATPTSSTQASSTDDKEQTPAQANRNDNSNPQQGNGKNIKGGAENLVTEDTKTPAPVWAHAHLRPSLKIPPTAKDERKLFVGGLPGNSKYLITTCSSWIEFLLVRQNLFIAGHDS